MSLVLGGLVISGWAGAEPTQPDNSNVDRMALPIRGDALRVPLPAGVSAGDVAAGRDLVETRSAVDRQVGSLALGKDSGAVDRVVALADGTGATVLPNLAQRRTQPLAAAAIGLPAQVPVTNDLTFTYNSPTLPWTPSELSDIQQMISAAYPVIRSVEGPPLFANTVNVRKTSEAAQGVAAYYDVSTNEITVVGSPMIDVIVHEIIHAFRDDLVLGPSIWEEGMTRAAELEVVDRLADYTHPSPHHSYTYAVYYEALNDQRIGARYGSIWSGQPAFALLRYELSGYAWAKPLIEESGFFAAFNAELYSQALVDPSVPFTESKLVAIAASARPQVEGLPFATWYASQGIFDSDPPTGNILYQRINQWTVDNFSRDANGVETPNGGVTISWERRDFQHQLLDSGSGIAEPLGWVDASPTIALGTSPARVDLTATAPRVGASGVVSDTAIRPRRAESSQNPAGVFGVVPRDLGGTLTVTPLAPAGSPISTSVVDGGFSLPSLTGFRGTLKASLTYTDGRQVTRIFTKDASDYFLKLPDRPTNDAFLTARVLNGSAGTVTGSTVGASKEPGERNHADNPGGASVWFRWTAPANGSLVVDALTSGFDTLLEAYSGSSISTLVPIVANDNDDGVLQSSIGPFTVTAGTTYSIAVDGAAGQMGDLAVAWRHTATASPIAGLPGKLVP